MSFIHFFFFFFPPLTSFFFFFFNDTATTEIYTLSLHDALPISVWLLRDLWHFHFYGETPLKLVAGREQIGKHTSELQSHVNLVCRLLLEKKKKKKKKQNHDKQKK